MACRLCFWLGICPVSIFGRKFWLDMASGCSFHLHWRHWMPNLFQLINIAFDFNFFSGHHSLPFFGLPPLWVLPTIAHDQMLTYTALWSNNIGFLHLYFRRLSSFEPGKKWFSGNYVFLMRNILMTIYSFISGITTCKTMPTNNQILMQ